ncbi:MAG: hypothetical protein FJ042_06260 [Candidatus Cloacimonetes bacterium]|nr:hypothetical protein [Candidatus Cloacimonadota bacterium]
MKQSLEHYTADLMSFRIILEGLIHNINTPLNLVLGYTQQKMKDQPECEILPMIYTAGLKIDDILRNSYKNVIQRMIFRKTSFCLNQWLQDEIKFLENYLHFKHHCRIGLVMTSETVIVYASVMLLTVCFEKLMLSLTGQETKDLVEIGIRTATDEGTPLIEVTCQEQPGIHDTLDDLIKQISAPARIMDAGELRLSELFYLNWHQTRSDIHVMIKILS